MGTLDLVSDIGHAFLRHQFSQILKTGNAVDVSTSQQSPHKNHQTGVSNR